MSVSRVVANQCQVANFSTVGSSGFILLYYVVIAVVGDFG
jgi:hypothetical protein